VVGNRSADRLAICHNKFVIFTSFFAVRRLFSSGFGCKKLIKNAAIIAIFVISLAIND